MLPLVILLTAWIASGPEGGIIQALELSDSDGSLFAGTVPGLWVMKSGRWERVEDPNVEYVEVTSIASLFTYVLIGSQRGAYLSKDNGVSWKEVKDVGKRYINRTRIFKYHDGIRMVICTDNGVFVSDDGGENFKTVPGFVNKKVVDVGYSGAKDQMYILTEKALYVSTAQGWIDMQIPKHPDDNFTCLLIVEIPGGDVYVYAGTQWGVIYAKKGSAAWRADVLGGSIGIISKDPAPEVEEIYASVFSKGVAVCSLKDNKWEYINEGLPYLTVTEVVAKNGRVYCGLAGAGVFERVGETWVPKNDGLLATIVVDIEAFQRRIFAGVLGYGVWESEDCVSWNWIEKSPAFVLDIDIWKDTIYVAAGSKLYIKKGSEWDSLVVSPSESTAVSVCRCDRGLYVGTMDGVYFSEDGVRFNKIEGISGRVYSFAVKGDTVILGTEYGVYVVTGGVNLGDITPDTTIKRTVKVDVSSSGRVFAHLTSRVDIPYEGVLFYSDDLGKTWNEVVEANELWSFALSDSSNSFLLFGKKENIKVTTDTLYASENWIDISEELSGIAPIVTRVYHKNYKGVLVGTWNGIYALLPEGTPSVSIKSSPGAFSPDGDGINDLTTFTINYLAEYPVDWTIEITDEEKNSVYTEKGYKEPIPMFLWDGYAEDGMLCKNGSYKVYLRLRDIFLNSAEDSVNVDLSKVPLATADSNATYPPNTRKIKVTPEGVTRVVYTSFNTPEVFYTEEETGSFCEPLCLSNTKDVYSLYPSISGDEVAVVLWVERMGEGDVLLLYENGRIDTVAIGDSIYSPQPFSEDGDVAVVWIDAGVLKYRRKDQDGWGDERIIDIEVNNCEIQEVFIVFEKNGKIYLYDVEEDNVEFITEGKNPSIALHDFLHIVWERDGKLFYKRKDTDWSNEEEIGEGKNPVIGVNIYDDPYVVFENNGEVFYVQKQNGEWVINKIGEGIYPTCPDILYYGDFMSAYTDIENKKVRIFGVEDTTPLLAEIEYPDTVFIPDSLEIIASFNKPISVFSISILLPDGSKDTVPWVKENDTLYHAVYYFEENTQEGMAEIEVYAEDYSGKVFSKLVYVYIKKSPSITELIENVHINPNPVKGIDEIEVIFDLKEDADIVFEVYSIRGRKLVEKTERFSKGRSHTYEMDVSQLGTDLYILRVIAKGKDEIKEVKKRFVVIR